MSKAETAKRYLLFLIGIFIMSMGTAIITSAGLGTSPVSSLPYVLSLKFAPTLGTFTLIVNAALLVVQILLLRKNFNLIQLLQLPAALVFGVFIDFSMSLVAPLVPSFYPLRVVMLLIGCVVIALGITLEVIANVVEQDTAERLCKHTLTLKPLAFPLHTRQRTLTPIWVSLFLSAGTIRIMTCVAVVMVTFI